VIATLLGVSYRYPGADSPALRNVSLDIAEDAFLLLAGPSAGGKSSLLRLFNGLIPQFHGGEVSGQMRVGEMDPARTPTRQMARIAGMVFQEPEAQSVADTVEDEIAFGMEQHGVPALEMRRRVETLFESLHIEQLRSRTLATLSGGERQRVAIAAVLALQPRLLLLDEPTSQLDPAGADAVIDAICRLHAAGDLAVLVAEHRLDRLLPHVSGVLGVQGGIVTEYSARDAAARLASVPAVCEIGRRLKLTTVPLTVSEAKAALTGRVLHLGTHQDSRTPGAELLRVEGLSVAYGELTALRDATFSLSEGEIVALVGPNGSGKTTLFRAIAGLIRQAEGRVRFRGSEAPSGVVERSAFAGLVPQDPAIALYHESVREELTETLRNRHSKESVDGSLERWNLASLGARHPRDLSVGQQQRVAIGAMLAHEPAVWMLDEPTRGADSVAKAWLADALRRHAENGGAAIVATHDLESAARYATRVIALAEGAVRYDLPMRQAFGSDGPSPTQAARLLPGAVLPEEVEA